MNPSFETEFDRLLEKQLRSAKGQRLEMLKKDKTGEKRLFCEVIRPVLPTAADELIMEYELQSMSGVRIYLDFFLPRLRWALECEGYVAHAEKITRDRFDFEKARVRAMAAYRITPIPFSWDEITHKSEACRRSLYELLGRQSVVPDAAYTDLSVYEREVIRYAIWLNRPLRMKDIFHCTGKKKDTAIKILQGMVAKELIVPLYQGKQRIYQYMLTEKARRYLI